jgi:drug/metabolite transporter (DMT)-like permease
MSASPPSHLSSRVIVAFACVYFFWGSTYTAIRIAGTHLAPPLVGACRTLLSTVLLAGFCVLRGKSLKVTRGEAWRLALVGVLLMSANNVLLTWAETMVASGLASLVVATMPIMIALIETGMPGGESLNKRGWAGTLLGTLGIVALVWPSLRRSTSDVGARGERHLLAFGILLVAALAFAVGSVLARRSKFKMDSFVATTWEIGAACVLNLVIAVGGGTLRTAVWTRTGVLAVVYLAIFGTIVGLSAYTYLLQHVPVTKVSTYAFVNPMIAVLLGIVLLGERLAATEVLGMGMIVASVAMVILSRVRRGTGAENAPTEDATADLREA